jgi:YhcH/YjgK/YiaL family protein
MIIDRLERAEKYYFLNENLKTAFKFIEKNDLKSLKPGKYEIDGENAYLIIAEGKPDADFENKLEAHVKYIDIQMAVIGSFGLSWKAIEDCNNLIAEYEPEEDAAYYSDKSDFEIMLNPGNFAILFPEDAHYPKPPVENIKKAVFKIKL